MIENHGKFRNSPRGKRSCQENLEGNAMLDRREIVKRACLAALGAALPWSRAVALDENSVTLPFDNGERRLVKYPQKRPMIGLTSRPPQLETPFSVLNDGAITPNSAFFVRYHLADIPYQLDRDRFTLKVKGKVERPLQLSLKEIRKLPAVELVAINQCSGNSRGFFEPRVAGGQLGNGAMGNARWRGVPLKTISTWPACEPAPGRSRWTAWTSR
jgi:sulfite dehydrogenase (cytochrome) subunit A